MKISVVAVGLKMPKWADEACEDYLHRFPSDWKLELKTVKAEDRNTRTIPKVMQAEAERIRAALPKDAIKVIMDERGADPTSTKLAQQINRWGDQGRPIAFIIGGADGIDPGLKAEADFTLRLSSLTLPHAMARVLLLEPQLVPSPQPSLSSGLSYGFLSCIQVATQTGAFERCGL